MPGKTFPIASDNDQQAETCREDTIKKPPFGVVFLCP